MQYCSFLTGVAPSPTVPPVFQNFPIGRVRRAWHPLSSSLFSIFPLDRCRTSSKPRGRRGICGRGAISFPWLTARAAAAVLDERGTLVPECLRDAPLVKFHRGQREQDRAHLLSSSLPNTFAFIAPGVDGEGLRVAVENAVRAEWKNIADAVHEELKGKFRILADGAGWDVHWDKQVDHHWDIRVSMLPPLEESAVTAALKATNTPIVGKPLDEPIKRRVALVNALAAADKHIRHYPPHAPEDDRRPKCALTGAESRMGPLAVEANNRFWGQGKDAPKVNAITESHIGGTRLQSKDRLGAVGLIKRYAWTCYFAKRLEMEGANAMRKPDTATVAAAGWLR